MTRSCKDYPSFRKFNQKLQSLYSADVVSSTSKIGDSQLVIITATCINDEYALHGESICEETANLLCKIIFEPNEENEEFSAEDFKQEKRQLKENLESQFNDKRVYANIKAGELMYKGDKYSINLSGTEEKIENLTSGCVYRSYKDMIDSARVEIICIGSNDTDGVKKVFAEKFAHRSGNIENCKTKIFETSGEVKNHVERTEVTQSKLIMGFSSGCAIGISTEEELAAARLMSAVLGGTAHSKLFNNVREKLSLCYYCMSSLDLYKGTLKVESGVESENIQKTKDAVLKEIEDMKNGVISDEEIASAKLSIINFFTTSVDSAKGTQSWYLSEILKGTNISVEERSKMVNAVTKEQVIEMAKKLVLDTVYVLTGTEDNEDE